MKFSTGRLVIVFLCVCSIVFADNLFQSYTPTEDEWRQVREEVTTGNTSTPSYNNDSLDRPYIPTRREWIQLQLDLFKNRINSINNSNVDFVIDDNQIKCFLKIEDASMPNIDCIKNEIDQWMDNLKAEHEWAHPLKLSYEVTNINIEREDQRPSEE